MDTKKLSNDLTVSGQIQAYDLDSLKASGVKSIICNRPDNEDFGQPSFNAIAEAAKAAGLEFRFMPVMSGSVSLENGEDFLEITNELPKPIHAYCRSGTRCTILWALAELKKGVSRESLIKQAIAAGYDISKAI